MVERFKLCPHQFLPGKIMVEYWRDGVFVAAIYPHQDGIRIASKYMTDVVREEEPVMSVGGWVPSAIIKLDTQKPLGKED